MFSEAINNRLHIEETNPYNIKFLVLIIPNINQAHPCEYGKVFENDFQIKKVPKRFAQVDRFYDRLKTDLKHDQISFLDSTPQLRLSNKLTYYLYDNHMNKLGHQIVSDILVPQIKTLTSDQ